MNDLDSLFSFYESLMNDFKDGKNIGNQIPIINECLKIIDQYLIENSHDPSSDLTKDIQIVGFWFYRVREAHFLNH